MFVVDPHIPASVGAAVEKIPMRAAEGMPLLAEKLVEKYAE